MFKSVLRRSEKNKIKAVFKLQFHAIQVPEFGGDALVVSVVPADVGKPTVKLKKATIKDGNCYWDDSVYETVKFIRDPKSGKIHEKIYYFVLGAVKAGFLGEASIDMSSYASSTKISYVTLPIMNTKSDTLLQVSIQRMPESVDQRVDEDSETAKLNSISKSARVHTSNGDMERSTRIGPVEETQLSENTNHSTKMNGNQRKSGMFDVTKSHADSNTEIDTVHQDSYALFSSTIHGEVLQQPTADALEDLCDKQFKSREHNGRLAQESSTDESSGSSTEDNIVIEKLKGELTALSRQAETSDLELQALRKQVVKENRRGNDLAREIGKLKDERDLLKEECEKLKSFPCRLNEETPRYKVNLGGDNSQALLSELLEELDYEKDLNNNLRIQLQKTQDSNSELLLAVRDLDELLEHKDKEIANLEVLQDENIKRNADTDDLEQRALEDLAMEHPKAKDVKTFEQNILPLQNEIEIIRRGKVEIEAHMEQLALDYEILKQENHDMSYKLEQSELKEQLNYESSPTFTVVNELQTQIENSESELNQKSRGCFDFLNTISELEVQVKDLENKLRKRSQEQSDSLVMIKELENEIMDLEEELENQAQGFESDLEALICAKVEQEQRAIKADDCVRKMQWKNTNTVELLQEELRKILMQVVSTFEANESLAAKAQAESRQLRLQKSQLEEELKMASESLQLIKDQYAARVDELANELVSKSRQVEELTLKIDEKSNQLDHDARHAEKTRKHLTQEISLLKAYLETLLTENKVLAKQTEDRDSLISELNHLKRSFGEAESLLENAVKENMELETINASVKDSADESLKELHDLPCQKEFEVCSLKAQCNELMQLSSENENFTQQMCQSKPCANRKEDSFNNIKRKPNGRTSFSDGAKVASKDKLQLVSCGKNEVATLKEKIKMLEGLVKQKESALETSSKSFLSKEKELQKKYEELEQRLEDFTSYMEISSEENPNQLIMKVGLPKQGDSENQSRTDSLKSERAYPNLPMLINLENSEERESKLSDMEAGNGNELLSKEMELLKKKNKQTEIELIEMQERYSEISLKFAEVEGERQQLVMKIRNLKKNPSTSIIHQ